MAVCYLHAATLIQSVLITHVCLSPSMTLLCGSLPDSHMQDDYISIHISSSASHGSSLCIVVVLRGPWMLDSLRRVTRLLHGASALRTPRYMQVMLKLNPQGLLCQTALASAATFATASSQMPLE